MVSIPGLPQGLNHGVGLAVHKETPRHEPVQIAPGFRHEVGFTILFSGIIALRRIELILVFKWENQALADLASVESRPNAPMSAK